MPKSYTFRSEQKTEIEDAIKSANDKKCYRRLQVLKLRCDGRKNNKYLKLLVIAILTSAYLFQSISKWEYRQLLMTNTQEITEN